MSEFRTLIEAQSPYRVLIAATGPQGPTGPAMTGDVTGIDSITFRYNGHTYRLSVVGETAEGVPEVNWVKVT